MKKIYHTSNCFKRFENYLKFSLVSLAILFTALPANATADGTKLTLSFKSTCNIERDQESDEIRFHVQFQGD